MMLALIRRLGGRLFRPTQVTRPRFQTESEIRLVELRQDELYRRLERISPPSPSPTNGIKTND